MGKYTLDNKDIEDAAGRRASKEKAYQPKNADYAYYHKGGYPVLVGDGSNPSQKARRKHRPHGVPILFKLANTELTSAEKKIKKEVAEERKKEYDRAYRESNREIKGTGKKRAYDTPTNIRKNGKDKLKEMKLDRKKSNRISDEIEELKEEMKKVAAEPFYKTSVSKKADNRRNAYNRMSAKEKESSRGKNLKKQLDKYKALRKKEREEIDRIADRKIQILQKKLDDKEKQQIGVIAGEEKLAKAANTIQQFAKKNKERKEATEYAVRDLKNELAKKRELKNEEKLKSFKEVNEKIGRDLYKNRTLYQTSEKILEELDLKSSRRDGYLLPTKGKEINVKKIKKLDTKLKNRLVRHIQSINQLDEPKKKTPQRERMIKEFLEMPLDKLEKVKLEDYDKLFTADKTPNEKEAIDKFREDARKEAKFFGYSKNLIITKKKLEEAVDDRLERAEDVVSQLVKGHIRGFNSAGGTETKEEELFKVLEVRKGTINPDKIEKRLKDSLAEHIENVNSSISRTKRFIVETKKIGEDFKKTDKDDIEERQKLKSLLKKKFKEGDKLSELKYILLTSDKGLGRIRPSNFEEWVKKTNENLERRIELELEKLKVRKEAEKKIIEVVIPRIRKIKEIKKEEKKSKSK